MSWCGTRFRQRRAQMVHPTIIMLWDFYLLGSCNLPVFNFFHLVCLIDLAKLLKLQEINWLKQL